jgi:hypothetical protein
MLRFFSYLLQPGVILTGLIGTALQVVLGFANLYNIGGIGDTIHGYGLTGYLGSGGLVAAITGLIYAMSQRRGTRFGSAGAGGFAGGISGSLGTGLNEAFGITPLQPGVEPLIDFSAVGTGLLGLVGMGGPDAPTSLDQLGDMTALRDVFAATAAGGGVGGFLGRSLFGARGGGGGKKVAHAH